VSDERPVAGALDRAFPGARLDLDLNDACAQGRIGYRLGTVLASGSSEMGAENVTS
jgi:hypothetical protein